METIKEQGSKPDASEQSFGLFFSAVFVLLAAYFVWNGPISVGVVLAIIGSILLILSFSRPLVLRPLKEMWLGLAVFLAKIVNPIVMAILFFVALWPTKVMLFLVGKSLMEHNEIDAETKSYWIHREKKYTDLTRQF